MKRAGMVLALLTMSAGCLGPQKRAVFTDAGEGYSEIARAQDGKLGLFSDGEEIVMVVSGAKTVIRNPYRAVKLAGMLDAPDALAMLHETLAGDADRAGLEARYEMDTEPGALSMTIRLAEGTTDAVVSLSGGEGVSHTSTSVAASEAARLAAALRRHLMTR
jgi:hypothetical protein